MAPAQNIRQRENPPCLVAHTHNLSRGTGFSCAIARRKRPTTCFPPNLYISPEIAYLMLLQSLLMCLRKNIAMISDLSMRSLLDISYYHSIMMQTQQFGLLVQGSVPQDHTQRSKQAQVRVFIFAFYLEERNDPQSVCLESDG